MMSGPHCHTLIAPSTRTDDPPLSPLRIELRSTGSLWVELDEEPLPHQRQRTLRRPVSTRTRVGGGGATLVITLGDATRLRIDLGGTVGQADPGWASTR
jgi:hypothetical protein